MERVERIGRYINDQLSDDEKSRFEKEMAADESLAIEVKRYGKLYDGLASLERSEIKNTLLKLDPELRRSKFRLRPLRRYLAIAASVLLILGVGLFWYANQSLSNKALAATYFESPVTTQRTTEQHVGLLQRGIQHYENDAYEEALVSLEQVMQEEDDHAAALYYQALAHFKLQAYSKSRQVAQDANLVNDNRFKYRVEWLRILTLLAEENESDAKGMLEDVSNNVEHPYQDRAQRLVAKIASPLRILVR